MTQLIGIFGGTFDPVHQGHLESLKLLDQHLGFDRVHWVLSARPPHKNDVSASIEHRFAMLELALRDDAQFEADASEINRPAQSYTFDTVQQFRQRYPGATLCLIIGGDSLHQLHTWFNYQALLNCVHVIVLNRPNYTLEVPAYLQQRVVANADQLSDYDAGKLVLFNQSKFAISSTELRQILSQGNPLPTNQARCQQYIVEPVLEYIQQHRLYNIDSMNSEQIKQQVIEALEDVKGVEINVINIKEVSDFADYMIVTSGTSDTHVKALARNASDHLRKQGVKPLNMNGEDVGEWVLVDFGDVVLHVMRPEVRDYYDLEKLWDEDVRNLVKQHREERDA